MPFIFFCFISLRYALTSFSTSFLKDVLNLYPRLVPGMSSVVSLLRIAVIIPSTASGYEVFNLSICLFQCSLVSLLNSSSFPISSLTSESSFIKSS